MTPNFRKLISLFISFCFILEQTAFAQSIDLSHYFVHNPSQAISQSDKFRPLHLRYLGYDNLSQDFKLLLDKGDTKKDDLENKAYIEENTQTLMKYFFIGLSLPNEKFWVNLRPDAPDNILDDDLAKTDIGRILLEADVQLKKDTAGLTSPQTQEGKVYWDKLYKRAGELFGSENITIPTLTRPWIVPNEIIIREAPDNAYIYKATLKVMLEEDYLKGYQPSAFSSQQSSPNFQPLTSNYSFSDPRLKELNEYSTQLIKETIIPKLTYAVNTSKRYAPLRQVYYSLILAQWFKARYADKDTTYSRLINRKDLTNLVSKESWSKTTYFKQYQKSFKDGEYNISEPVYTPFGQTIRSYFSGGTDLNLSLNASFGAVPKLNPKGPTILLNPAFRLPLAKPNEIELQIQATDEPGVLKQISIVKQAATDAQDSSSAVSPGVSSSGVKTEKEEAGIKEIFEQVKTALNERGIILLGKVLESYAQNLRAGRMSEKAIFRRIYQRAKFQKKFYRKG